MSLYGVTIRPFKRITVIITITAVYTCMRHNVYCIYISIYLSLYSTHDFSIMQICT